MFKRLLARLTADKDRDKAGSSPVPVRFIAIVSTLIVLALGTSAYVLAPILLADAAGPTAAANGGGAGAAQAGAAAKTADPGQDGGDSAAEVASDPADVPALNSSNNSVDGSANSDGASTTASGAAANSSTGTSSTSGSSNTSDGSSGSQANNGSNTPAPAPQTTVTLSIDASTMGRGYIMAPRSVAFSAGESVFDVLSRECRAFGIPMEHSFNPLYDSAYVEGIDNLYEFDGGPQSGWMFAVNGWYPNYGCSAYTLKPGDVIQWRYTCDLGADIGGFNAIGG